MPRAILPGESRRRDDRAPTRAPKTLTCHSQRPPRRGRADRADKRRPRRGTRREARTLVARAREAAEGLCDAVVLDLLAAAEQALDRREGRWPGRTDPPAVALTLAAPGVRLAGLMLGPFRLYQDGLPVEDWQGAKGQRMARYLLAQAHPIPRERLVELLWPEVDPEAGRRNLHQAVYSLRRTLRRLQPDLRHIVFENDCYCLNPDLEVWCDVREFEALVEEGHRLARAGYPEDALGDYTAAERLYRGEYLEDTPCEEWALAERDYLAALHSEAMHRAAELNVALGRVEEGIGCARRLLVRQPADEVAHQVVIRGQLAAGHRGEALRQYRSCERALEREYGLSPSPETASLFEGLRVVGGVLR